MRSGSRPLVIQASRVVLPDGIRPAEVWISGGKIDDVRPITAPPGARAWPGGAREPGGATVEPGGAGEPGGARAGSGGGVEPGGVSEIVLADDEVLLPGLVDTHVHVNEPGRTDWEGFATATRAAAAGGITTIVDMPLNSIPPTTNAEALRIKREEAAGHVHVDVGFWGGVVPGSLGFMSRLHDGGVFGFKVFLQDSGVPEFPPVDQAGLHQVMERAAALGSVVLVHAEDPAAIGAAPPPAGRAYASYLASRPPAAEVAAIAQVIDAAERAGARAHILHLSAADALPLLETARGRGAAISVETCPHYLALAAEDIPDGATQFKCAPPIRDRANRERLWQALRDGIIDCVVSDHSPCPPAMKHLADGDFGAAWGGISSVQLSLPVVWTQARRRGFSLDDVARWMAARPAQIAGVPGKGAIAPGAAADLTAFAPDETFTVDPLRLQHRHKVTPYAGQRLHGVVRRTWLGGTPVDTGQASGRLLARQEHTR